MRVLSACRPRKRTGIDRAVLTSLRLLAKRHEFPADQITELEDDLRALVVQTNLALISACGVSTVAATQLLITAGGNRQANSATHHRFGPHVQRPQD